MFKILSYGNLIVLLCSFDVSWAECTRPPVVEHARQISFYLSTIYPNGFRVKYACDTGYVMQFRDTIHCDNGFWMSQSMSHGFDRLMLPQCKWMEHDGGNGNKGGGENGNFGMDSNKIFLVVIVATVILTVVVCCIRLSNITSIPLRRRRRSGVHFSIDPHSVSYNSVRDYESSAPRPPPSPGPSHSAIRHPSVSVSLEESFECYSMTPSSSNNKLEGLHVAEVA